MTWLEVYWSIRGSVEVMKISGCDEVSPLFSKFVNPVEFRSQGIAGCHFLKRRRLGIISCKSIKRRQEHVHRQRYIDSLGITGRL